MTRPSPKPQTVRFAAPLAAIVLVGLSIADFVVHGSVDQFLIGALLVIVLTSGGARLDKAILRNLGDRLYEAADDERPPR